MRFPVALGFAFRQSTIPRSRIAVPHHVIRRAMSKDRELSIETMLAHAGCDAGGVGTDEQHGGVTPPIHMASTYERSTDLEYPKGFVYGRVGNPTRALFESTMAKVEGGGEAAAFASGMAAVSAIFQASPKAHVLLPDDVYHGTRTVLNTVFDGWLSYSTVDFTDLDAVSAAASEAASRGVPRVVTWVETPSNPLLKVSDVPAIAAAVKAAVKAAVTNKSPASTPTSPSFLDPPCACEAVVVVDSTWLTPALMRPLEWGADLTVHATTKYLGGHSDMVGGVVVAAKKKSAEEEGEAGGGATGADDGAKSLFDKVRDVQCLAGTQQAPFDCWLALRGMRSLGARLRVHCANALAVAEFLEDHPAVAAVHYPGLPTHPGHSTMRAQCHGAEELGFGGMLSFQPKGGRGAAVCVAANLKLIRRATSLGGTESLVEHRRSIEPPDSSTPDDLLRLSVGLENETDLLRDLDQALAAVGKPR